MESNNKQNNKLQTGLMIKDWMFDGKKTNQFLTRFDVWAKRIEELDDESKCEQFSLMTTPKLWERVTSLSGFKTKDWPKMRRELKEAFVEDEFDRYMPADLYALAGRTKKKGAPSSYADIMKFYLKYSQISNYLVERDSLSQQDETRLFLQAIDQKVVDMLERRAEAQALASKADQDGPKGDDEDGEPSIAHVPQLKQVIRDIKVIFEAAYAYGNIASGLKRDGAESDDASSSSDVDVSGGNRTKAKLLTSAQVRHKAEARQRNQDRQARQLANLSKRIDSFAALQADIERSRYEYEDKQYVSNGTYEYEPDGRRHANDNPAYMVNEAYLSDGEYEDEEEDEDW